jgi:aromatic ring-opening dioxygenase catalytic subunit (LigB family)
MQCEDFRRMMGAGQDSDLIAGYARLRERIAAARPDVLVVFDTHWFTTGYHLVDAGSRYSGTFVSDEMPWYLHGVPYDYRGHPGLAYEIEAASRERGGFNRAIANPGLGRHYATLNLVKQLRLEHDDVPVVGVSSCQNCRWQHFLESGAAVAEGIRRSGLRAVLLASGALSHRFNDIDWKPSHPRIFHESNVSSPENVESDKGAIELFRQGRHDLILERWDTEYRKRFWEASGAHYLQMVGALGGADCRTKGEPLSEYENARGTGNIHLWFDLAAEG